jgi:hypothetical protein
MITQNTSNETVEPNETMVMLGNYLLDHDWTESLRHYHYMRVIFTSKASAKFYEIKLLPSHVVVDGIRKIYYEDPQLMEYIEGLNAIAEKSESDMANG